MEFSYWHMQEKNVLKTVNFVEKKLCTLYMASSVRLLLFIFHSYILIFYTNIAWLKDLENHLKYIPEFTLEFTNTPTHTHTHKLSTYYIHKIAKEYLLKHDIYSNMSCRCYYLILCLYTVCNTLNLTKKVSIKYINA